MAAVETISSARWELGDRLSTVGALRAQAGWFHNRPGVAFV